MYIEEKKQIYTYNTRMHLYIDSFLMRNSSFSANELSHSFIFILNYSTIDSSLSWQFH